MLLTPPTVHKALLILSSAILAIAPEIAFAQSVPMLVQAEAMTPASSSTAPMTVGYDIAALSGRFISQQSGTAPSTPSRAASVDVNVPTGTYYLWARIAGATATSDAVYVGIDGSIARVFPQAQGPYEWVRVPITTGGSSYNFSLGGIHTIHVSSAEVGAKLDAVYLTNNASDVPGFTQPMRLLLEAESFNRTAQMTVGNDDSALGRQHLTPTTGSATPVQGANLQVHMPAGTWYLWARIAGPTSANDAVYVGIDASFARVFPQTPGPYEWKRVPTSDGGSVYGFSLTTAGLRTVKIGYGEVSAKTDAVYLTNDASEVPIFAPMRRVIEAESFTLLAVNPPMTVGTDADANGAQYIGVMTGTGSTNPVQEARTTIHVPSGGGTYYLWARLKGLSITSDALYIGFDNTWNRVFPSSPGTYEWVRVESGTALSAGAHTIQVGHGEIGARLDAVYVTHDPNETPTGASTPPPPPPPSGECANPAGGYEGYGRSATGGAGKTVYTVTNRNSSGAGSLRDAVSQSDRCVVFAVAGPIDLGGSSISVRGNNITIDGFTAQSPGITLLNGGLFISGQTNVIVRGIRVRNAPEDGIKIYNSQRVVLDHCSVHNFTDGAIDITEGSRDVTVQWCIIGPRNVDIHNFLNLIAYQAYRITEHHNLFYRGRDRSPNVSWIRSPGSTPPDVVLDFRANLVWGFYQRGTHMRDGWGNIVNNYYYGVDGGTSDIDAIDHNDADGGRWYTSGNYSRNGHNLNDNGNWSTPHTVPPVTTQTAQAAAQLILDNAGARGPNFPLDSVDQSFINAIRSTGL